MNGIVDNIAKWEGDENWKNIMISKGYLLIDVTNIFCGPGFTYDGTNFFPPVEDNQ